jgi:hypothetical protein
VKPDRARIRRKKQDGTVLETIVEFKAPEQALGFFNEFRKKCGEKCAPNKERDEALRAVIAQQDREARK